MAHRTHKAFNSLIHRVTAEYEKVGDWIRIGHMMDEFKGPIWEAEYEKVGDWIRIGHMMDEFKGPIWEKKYERELRTESDTNTASADEASLTTRATDQKEGG
jgi:hypothetical protein